VLQVRNLYSGYYENKQYTPILNNINMHIGNNEIVGVLGANGSGKSTLIKSLLGEIYASKGDVTYEGESIYKKENYVKFRREAIYVKQESFNSLKPLKTINFQIGKLYDWKPFDEERVKLLFANLNLDPQILKMKAIQLSEGMKHRVVITMALLTDPKLLVLDEPTTGLDSISIYNFLTLLKTIKKKTSVLISSNDVNAIFEICDRIYILYDGEIIEDGLYSDIRDTPYHPYTEMLMRYTPLYSNRNVALVKTHNNKNDGCAFIDNCPHNRVQCETKIEYNTTGTHGYRCIRAKEWKHDTA
jgi:oligopeptide/dipeptide ABC transporter, ATP-binding protein, C-terminal domain